MFFIRLKFFAIALMTFLFLFNNLFTAQCEEKESLGTDLNGKNTKLDTQATNNPSLKAPEIPPLKPGEWRPLFDLGKNLFPSVIIGSATLKEEGGDKTHLGDPWGTMGIAVCSPKKECPITIEIAGETFNKQTTFTGKLPEKGTTYYIYPRIKYNYEKLLAVKQTVPENMVFRVKIDEEEEKEETFRIQVRSINECVFGFVDSEGKFNDVSWFFAAYVNENHPIINQILKEAISAERIDSFAGYYGTKEEVLKEIKAIWDTLKSKEMHYSNINTTADDDDPNIASQHVRLLSESIKYSQANCVDGSVLISSILRKIGLDVNLVLLPTHMLISVNLDEKGKNFICIETTMLGKNTLEEAIEKGDSLVAENKNKFESEKEEHRGYNIINIKSARNMGVIPIKDSF